MGFLTNIGRHLDDAEAFNNYINYWKDKANRPTRVGQGDPKPPQKVLYVHPFGLDYDADMTLECTGTEERWNTYGTKFGTRTKDAATAVAPKIRAFRPARVVIKVLTSQTGHMERSKRTKTPYLKYDGKAGSVPFGRSGANDEELTAFNAIREQFKVSGSIPANLRLSRIKERV